MSKDKYLPHKNQDRDRLMNYLIKRGVSVQDASNIVGWNRSDTARNLYSKAKSWGKRPNIIKRAFRWALGS